ncbi:hypothetical protein ACFVH6_25610 [Spirillospora sp. NPDC127200]
MGGLLIELEDGETSHDIAKKAIQAAMSEITTHHQSATEAAEDEYWDTLVQELELMQGEIIKALELAMWLDS